MTEKEWIPPHTHTEDGCEIIEWWRAGETGLIAAVTADGDWGCGYESRLSRELIVCTTIGKPVRRFNRLLWRAKDAAIGRGAGTEYCSPPQPIEEEPTQPAAREHYREEVPTPRSATPHRRHSNEPGFWQTLLRIRKDETRAALRAYKRRTHSWPTCCGEDCRVGVVAGALYIRCAVGGEKK